jgi:hypothetical protein
MNSWGSYPIRVGTFEFIHTQPNYITTASNNSATVGAPIYLIYFLILLVSIVAIWANKWIPYPLKNLTITKAKSIFKMDSQVTTKAYEESKQPDLNHPSLSAEGNRLQSIERELLMTEFPEFNGGHLQQIDSLATIIENADVSLDLLQTSWDGEIFSTHKSIGMMNNSILRTNVSQPVHRNHDWLSHDQATQPRRRCLRELLQDCSSLT